MGESQESIEDESHDDSLPYAHCRPQPMPGRERLQLQKSNVCSRAYFVVVMVFFHVYIINIIALLLYVHYSNGPGDINISTDRGSDAPVRGSGSNLPQPDPPSREPDMDYSQRFSLPRIEGIRVGHVQRVSLLPDRDHEMKTLSLKPLLFEIPGFLSEEECRVVVQLAQLKGMMESQTVAPSGGQEEPMQPPLSLSTEETFRLLDLDQDGLLQKQEILSHSRSRDGSWLSPENLRQILTGLEASPAGMLTMEEFRHACDLSQHPLQQQNATRHGQTKRRSKHTWLYQGPGSHNVLHTLRNRVTRLTHLPSPLVELSEPLQVIRYEQGGYSHAHHDSSLPQTDTTCAHTRLAGNTSALTEIACRYITVLFYLNSVEGGGETSFPVADNRTYEEEALVQDDVDLTNTQQSCGRGNLRVRPTTGTALLWYNHLSDGRGWMGELDEYSLHGGCPVAHGVKWVANSWVNVDPDHQRQARYQRLVTHRQEAGPSKDTKHHPLSHSDLHQDL